MNIKIIYKDKIADTWSFVFPKEIHIFAII